LGVKSEPNPKSSWGVIKEGALSQDTSLIFGDKMIILELKKLLDYYFASLQIAPQLHLP
jgi:hypothetical protein